MKKLFIFTLTLLTLTACQPNEKRPPQASISSESIETETTMTVPAAGFEDVEEMIVVEDENEVINESEDNSPLRVVEISAKRFEFTPSVIRAKQGERILIKINNQDTTHNFFIPDLNEFSNAEEFMLNTSKKGEFSFFCANFCGASHDGMSGKIIIE